MKRQGKELENAKRPNGNALVVRQLENTVLLRWIRNWLKAIFGNAADTFSILLQTFHLSRLPQHSVQRGYIRQCRGHVFDTTSNFPLKPISPTLCLAWLYFYLSLRAANGSTKIRVLHLLPGSGRDRIACRLEVQDLDHGIDKALSYVWGKRQDPKPIWVDGQLFQITGNLYEILLNLRRPSTSRVLWIDAICINQSDLEEKLHQVRLMGEIYSNARIVTIWLSGQTPGVNLTPDPYNSMAPFPSSFGNKNVDQYNVVSIIKWVDQLFKVHSFERDHLVAWVLLLH
ncbi:heterokaryon incompatibility protein-domain-containing protein [Xylaria grammica]|nr:heterokaryon incompatibility protein-domain-containing protein [Xylaria grammica]